MSAETSENLLEACAKAGAALKVRKLSVSSMEFLLDLQAVVEAQIDVEPSKRAAAVMHLKRLHEATGIAIKSLGGRR